MGRRLFGRAPGQFLFVPGQPGGVAGVRADFHFRAGFFQGRLAFLAAGDFFGQGQAVPQRRAVGLPGIGDAPFQPSLSHPATSRAA